MAKLSPEHIEQVATLARLQLTDQEKQMYADQLSAVFAYMEMLEEVDTSQVDETCQVTGLEDVMRKDEVVDCDPDTRQKLIELFPDRVGDLLKVKGVFDQSNEP